MLNKLNIGPRLVLLIATQTLVLAIIGLTAVLGLNYASDTTESLNKNVIEQVTLNQLNEVVRSDLIDMINRVSNEKMNWQEAQANLLAARNLFINNWIEYKEDKTTQEINELEASLGDEYKNIVRSFDILKRHFKNQDLVNLTYFIENESPKLITPFLTELNERVNEYQLISEALFEQSINNNKTLFYASSGVMLFGLIIAVLLGYMIYRSISQPIKSISDTVKKVSGGDYYVRTNVKGDDELGQLGTAFDDLLEDKVATLVQIEKDNDQLNHSVIRLLQAVSNLSKRDLSIKIPVTEDVTGPIADALNLFSSETSKVLRGVRVISEQVARASNTVKIQSDTVIKVAGEEQKEVAATSKELANAASGMEHISELATACNIAAEKAINTTHTALQTVTSTTEGMSNIRETIHKAEKRIKRLGERSQEISRAVNLINSISERTHILALNASMHAASAGEAGRGFAVVADEVQRLAENARDATSQISTLVSNIQIETVDSVDTMNNVISQVVEGNRLAEEAGTQMKKTKDNTEELVNSVREIAKSSVEQARMTSDLQIHAQQIMESTKKTSAQLQEQTIQTNHLVNYAKGLLKAVQVFKLPAVPGSEQMQTAVEDNVINAEVRMKAS